jgi:hypothetical protein
MNFDPISIAAIGIYFDANPNITMSEGFTALVQLGYSMSEVRHGFNCWVVEQHIHV